MSHHETYHRATFPHLSMQYTEDSMTDNWKQEELERQKCDQLMIQYAVYGVDKDGNPTGSIICPRLAKLLLNADNRDYIVLEDNQEIYVYNGSYYEPIGKGILEQRVNYYLDDKTTKHRKQEVIDFIKNQEYVKREDLNPPTNLINVKNGIYNIDTGEIEPHTPDYYFLSEIPINYDPKAKIDKIQRFHEDLLNIEDINIIQEFFGDCLHRDYRFKKALQLVGKTNTGKTQELGLLERFIGEKNTSNITLHDICKDKYATAELYGKHANISGDIGSQSLRQVQMFLMTTGGDRIRAQKKYGQPFNFKNYAKLLFSCNIIPDTEVKTNAYYGRWLVLEYDNQFDEETRNPNIIDEITTEKEMSGLFNWAIEGLLQLIDQRGYSPHRALEEVKEYMQKGKNPIREFTQGYIEPCSEGVETKEYVYDCYQEFCTIHNYPIKERNVFSRKFKPEAPMHMSDGQQLKGGKKTWKGIKCTWERPGEQQELVI